MTIEDIQKVLDPYELRGVIGDGAFSIIRLAYNKTEKTFSACKIISRQKLLFHNLDKRFENEIRILQQMHHPGVVGLYDIRKDDYFYYIFEEFCSNGELFQYIVSKGKLSENEAQIYARQILETLKYVHSLGICHRDLKPENILLDSNNFIKITDFGLSRFVGNSGMVETPCGSPCYASPECISGIPYDGRKSDIWSAGVMTYAMLTGHIPWTKRNQKQLFDQIQKGDYIIPSYLSDECASFLKGLMNVDASHRFSIDHALNHPWLLPSRDKIFFRPYKHAYPSLRNVDKFFEREISDLDLSSLLLDQNESFESNLIRKMINSKITVRKYNTPKMPRVMRYDKG